MSEWASPDPSARARPAAPGAPPPVAPSVGVPAWASPPERRRGIVPLRPLTVGEVLDGSITMIRRHPRPMVALGVVGAVLYGAVTLVGYALTDAGATLTFDNTDADGTTTTSTFPWASTALVFLTGTLLLVVFSALAAGALRPALLGRPVTTADLRPAHPGRILAAGLLVTAIVTVLTVTLVGEIYAYVALAFVGPVIALEGATLGQALRRSRALVRGDWWRTFGILALARVIATVIGAMIAVPAGLLVSGASLFGTSADKLSTGSQLVLAAAAALTNLLTTPFLALVAALLYTDRRMRTEGLDVALQQAVDAQPDA